MSILDINNNIDNGDVLINMVKKFINDNYLAENNRYTITYEDDIYILLMQVKGVIVKNFNIEKLTNGLFKWGVVNRFDCNYCKNIKSLEGASLECKIFYCKFCRMLHDEEKLSKKTQITIQDIPE